MRSTHWKLNIIPTLSPMSNPLRYSGRMNRAHFSSANASISLSKCSHTLFAHSSSSCSTPSTPFCHVNDTTISPPFVVTTLKFTGDPVAFAGCENTIPSIPHPPPPPLLCSPSSGSNTKILLISYDESLVFPIIPSNHPLKLLKYLNSPIG